MFTKKLNENNKKRLYILRPNTGYIGFECEVNIVCQYRAYIGSMLVFNMSYIWVYVNKIILGQYW